MYCSILKAEIENLGPRHPETLVTQANLAEVLKMKGDFGAAEANYREVLDARIDVLGPRHPDTRRTQSNLAHLRDPDQSTLAGVLSRSGDTADAVAARRELVTSLSARGDKLGAARARGALARDLDADGDTAESMRMRGEALAALSSALGDDHPECVALSVDAGVALLSHGDVRAAVKELQTVRERFPDQTV